jgi:hypothetical protein
MPRQKATADEVSLDARRARVTLGIVGQVGQRPLVIVGGVVFAVSGMYRVLVLTADASYVVAIAVPLVLDAVAIALIFPQVTSVAAQALPSNRTGVGGAATQAVRQFDSSFGVALTIAFLGAASEPEALLMGFERIWWLLIAAGLVASFFALALRTEGALEHSFR